MIRVVLVDDHKLIRDGIKAILREDESIDVVGEAADGEEVVPLLREVKADVVLMDLNMPNKSGFDATVEVREEFPEVKVLILSMMASESYIAKLMDLGASGYILKNTGKEELLHAVKTVAAGNQYISMDIALGLVKKVQGIMPKTVQGSVKDTRRYTPREIEVLRLIAEGYTNAEIAEKLFTSKRTIETHRQNLIEKTQAKNTAALIKMVISEGIIEL